MKNIILSADDFGRSIERNEAIDQAFRQGLIKSAALMVNTPYTQDAVNKSIRGGGYLDCLHCHFNLVGGVTGGYQKPLTKEILGDKYICDGKDFLEYAGKRLCGRRGLSRILCFIPILKELEAQYKEFLRITGGAANNKHIDFHLYYNLNFPIAIALNIFTIRHHIRSVRYIGEHLKKSKRMILLWFLGSNSRTKTYPACNIDYYLQTKNDHPYSDIIELYVHPDMVNNQLQDNSVSEFGNPKRNLKDNIKLLSTDNEINFVSWTQV